MAWRRGQAYGQIFGTGCLLAPRIAWRKWRDAVRRQPVLCVKGAGPASCRGRAEPRAAVRACAAPVGWADEGIGSPDPQLSGFNVERVAVVAVDNPQGKHELLRDVEGGRRAGADARKKHLRAEEQRRDDVAEARREWAASLPSLDPERLECRASRHRR